MGGYTPNFRFWYPDFGDFVDAAMDQQRNFKIYDDVIRRRIFDYLFREKSVVNGTQRVPFTGQKAFNAYGMNVTIGSGNVGSNFDTPVSLELTLSGSEATDWSWSAISFISGWNSDPTLFNAAGYHNYDANNVELRGQIRLNSFDPIPQNVETTVTNTGAVPSPVQIQSFTTVSGPASGAPFAQANQVSIYTTGQIRVRRLLGTNVAGSIENYISLEGIKYSVAA